MSYIQTLLFSVVTRFLMVLAVASTLTSCKTTPTNPDGFFQAVVTCTKDNSQNAQAGAAVLKCLSGVVQGDYGACVSGLVTAGYWTVEEIACVLRLQATESAQRINKGTPTADDAIVLERANKLISEWQVQYR